MALVKKNWDGARGGTKRHLEETNSIYFIMRLIVLDLLEGGRSPGEGGTQVWFW